jgi:group I intron endonuclease
MESDSSQKNVVLGFYVIHNPITDKIYVGSGNLEKRRKTHEYKLNRNEHWNYKFQKAYNQDPNFQFVGVPVEGDTLEEKRKAALALEQITINELKGNPCLLNICMDVEKPMTGYKHSEESIEKNRQAALNLWKDPNFREKNVAAANAGKSAITPERKREISKILSEKISESYAAGNRKSLIGQTRTDEFKERNSNYITEKWKDPTYRETQRVARIGKMIAPNKVSVVGDDIEYESLTDAGRKLGMTKQSIVYRIASDNYPGWYKKE